MKRRALVIVLLLALLAVRLWDSRPYVVTGWEYTNLSGEPLMRISYRLPGGGIGHLDRAVIFTACIGKVAVGYTIPKACAE